MGFVVNQMPDSLNELLRRHKCSHFIERPELPSGTHDTLFAFWCFEFNLQALEFCLRRFELDPADSLEVLESVSQCIRMLLLCQAPHWYLYILGESE